MTNLVSFSEYLGLTDSKVLELKVALADGRVVADQAYVFAMLCRTLRPLGQGCEFTKFVIFLFPIFTISELFHKHFIT